MWASITAFFVAIPVIGKMVTQIIGLFTKTPAQQAEQTASDAQAGENSTNKTGRLP